MNEKNLRSLGDLDPEERKEIQRRAGLASVEARRKKKELQKELTLLLESGDTQRKMCIALIEAAMQGNVKAFVTIRDTIGEKPTGSVSVIIDDTAAREEALDEAFRRLRDGAEEA